MAWPISWFQKKNIKALAKISRIVLKSTLQMLAGFYRVIKGGFLQYLQGIPFNREIL